MWRIAMTDLNRLESLFFSALEKAPADRIAFLDQECASDPELRQRVERMLAAQPKIGGFLQPPAGTMSFSPENAGPQTVDAVPQTVDRPGRDEHVGAVIAGKYKLIEEIGEGGMGQVFMAQQTEPVKRAVAVKVIKAGMDSKAVLARFEAERQALAMMDHPNIARVLDAGATESGRPFFVMELVKGVPITQYCDDRKLIPRQRLELFVPVCQAIQHAHQKGIIHRDIKPSNVLVALYDDRAVPKVIDFGVAKATGQTLTDKTLMTGFGAVVGTPEYMSPEQASINNFDVDTRSDVYSLGVLLYELLTGSTPMDRKTLGKAALLEILRIVREVEVPRPSAKLSTIDTLPNVAANRGTEPAKLSKLMKGELDWLVLKALEKDRTRRYETANGFARDIQRYLDDEIVEARPPSTGYRLKKFVRRHKGQVIAASLVLFALLAGIAGTTWQAIRAERALANEATQRQLAEAKEQEANEERSKAVAAAEQERLAKEQAQKNLAFAKKGNEILGSVFAGLDPKKIAESGRPLQDVLRENLVKAVKELDGSAIGDPLDVAAMQDTLGRSLLGLGESGLAIEVFQRARDTRKAKLGPEHPDTLTSMACLALAYKDAGKLDLALTLFEETLKLQKAKLGPEHPYTLTCMHNLASAYEDAGKRDLALPLYEEALKLQKAKLGHDHPFTLTTMSNLGQAYQDAGKNDLALPLCQETLKLRKAKLGIDHPDTLISMNNLAWAYRDAKNLDLAQPLFEETLKLMKANLGPDHPETLNTMNNLALAYRDAGKHELALPLFEEKLRITKVKFGPEDPSTLANMNNLAEAFKRAGRNDLALPLLEETLKLQKAKLGPEHPSTVITMNNLALAYRAAGKNDKAELLQRDRLPLIKKKSGGESVAYARALASLGGTLLNQQQWTEAEPLLRECLAIREKTQPDLWSTFNIYSMLGGALLGQKKYIEAEPLLLKGYEGMKARERTIPQNGGGDLRIPEALDRLIEFYTATNKPEEVKKWQLERAKYLEIGPVPRERK
jgi:eukaryotic-like serine/threonine-protein kinase